MVVGFFDLLALLELPQNVETKTMNEREYEALERRIEERKRIKAMAEDLAQSRKETSANRKAETKRDGTSIDKAWGGGGGSPKRAKIAGDSFTAIQIRNGG